MDILQSIIRWVGTPQSLIAHTIFFIVMISLPAVGVSWYFSMLVLTTTVSLEAIYLSIFIQMGVNRHADEQRETRKVLTDVQETIEDVQETMEDVQDVVEDVQETVEDVQETIEEEEEINKG